MARLKILFFCIVVGITPASGQTYNKTIVVVVSADLYSGIENGLKTYVSDLQKEKYNVVMKISSMTTPEEVRAYLQSLYASVSPQLVGALLVGNIPYAQQFFVVTYTNPAIPPDSMNCITFQYYSDLDGVFSKTNARYPDSYSEHSGETFPEIWIGVLPMYYRNTPETINRVNWYLQKNHAYRTGFSGLQNGYLEVDEFTRATTQQQYSEAVNSMVSGTYSWAPLTVWGNTSFYVGNSVGLPSPSDAINKGLADSLYKVAVLRAHGTPTANGSLTTTMVKSLTIRPAIVWLDGCNTANLTYDDNILTEIVYNYKSRVLVGKGGATYVGGLGNNANGFYGHNIAEALLQGKSFGDALLTHFCVPLIWPWSTSFEMHNAPNVFLGDLTLTLFPTQATAATEAGDFISGEFNLQQNYPNPFNPSTTIRYDLPARSSVRLLVYNTLGQIVSDLVNSEQAAGWQQVVWNANLSSGMYFYKLEAVSVSDRTKRFVDMKKMLLLR